MESFARWVIRHRLAIVVMVALLTIAGIVSIVNFSRVESDISKFLPPEDPVVIRFNRAGERFGTVAVAMVAVESDDLFSRPGLERIERLTDSFKKIPGVSWVVSLTNVDDVKQTIVDGEKAVSVQGLLPNGAIPKDPAGLEKLRTYVLSRERLVGTVVSQDGRIANLIVNIRADADRVDVARALEKTARRAAPGVRLYFSGFPFWMKTMSDMILEDMTLLVPIVTLVIIIILLLSFGSLRGVLLPLATVLISSVWAMGLMAALDIPITTLSNTVPVLLIALGTAYAIHLLHRYNEVADANAPGDELIGSAMADVMLPICMAGLTTVIGFLSFLTSSLVFIRQTGVIAAFGIFSAMLIALTFLPAVLSWLKPPKVQTAEHGKMLSGPALMANRAGTAIIRRPRMLLIISAVVAVAAASFLPSLNRRFDMVAYFPANSDVRRADDMMRRELGGNVPLWVTVDGNVKNAFTLKSMLFVEKFLRTIPGVNNARSIAGLLSEINSAMNGRLAIPDTNAGVGNLWLNLEGRDILDQLVSSDGKHSLIQAVCDTADTSVLRKTASRVEAFLQKLPHRARLVNLDSAAEPLAASARRARMQRTAKLAALDIEFRLGGQDEAHALPPVKIEALISRVLRSKPETKPESLAGKFTTFMLSDESDLEFSDRELADKVARAAAKLFSGRRTDPGALQKAIQTNIPAEMLSADPEAADYLAKSLWLLGREIDSENQEEMLLSELLHALPPEAAHNRRLREDLRGDISELNDGLVYLPLEASENANTAEVQSLQFQQTGMHLISVNVDNRIIFSQLSSLGLAALMATILLMIQFRSFAAGLLGMIPMLLTLLVNFGVMGAFKIDLEPASVLIASMVVGVGIDYTIHFMSRTRLEMIRRGEMAGALEVTMRTAGRAIMINALTVAGGQLVFLAGQMVPLKTFGVLLALAMLISALTSVIVMPAILMLAKPRFIAGGKPGA
ncbi:MAG TPA: MMPL family transporter [Myxococcota bacterium]|nr:MMPL family transporter [Myxococcota bacterium]